jgi:hypothetical protein
MTLTVNDAVFQVLQPMVQQHTIDSFLSSVLADRHLLRPQTPDIRTLKGTLHAVDYSDLRDEGDRIL